MLATKVSYVTIKIYVWWHNFSKLSPCHPPISWQPLRLILFCFSCSRILLNALKQLYAICIHENYNNIFCALKYFYDVKEIKIVDLFQYFLFMKIIVCIFYSTGCKYFYVIRIFYPSSCFILHRVWIRNMKSFFWTLLQRQQWGKWFNNEKIILLRCNVTSTKNLIDQCLGEMMQ